MKKENKIKNVKLKKSKKMKKLLLIVAVMVGISFASCSTHQIKENQANKDSVTDSTDTAVVDSVAHADSIAK